MSCEFQYLCCEEDCEHPCCDWQASVKDLLRNSKLPKNQWKYHALRPDNEDDARAFDHLKDISDNILDIIHDETEPNNLIICSNRVGNGKTTWAIKILQSYCASIASDCYMKDNQRVLFVPTNQFILDAKDFNGPYRQRYYDMSALADTSDIVVWDDIGAADYSKIDYTHLLVAIDRRVFAGKYNIFTTNFTEKSDAFIERVGSRLADRIWESSEVVEIKGKGLRGC